MLVKASENPEIKCDLEIFDAINEEYYKLMKELKIYGI
jgi:hypothetical protein